jgi:hypothetical protein
VWYDKDLVHFLSSYHHTANMLDYEKRMKGHQELVESTEPEHRKD